MINVPAKSHIMVRVAQKYVPKFIVLTIDLFISMNIKMKLNQMFKKLNFDHNNTMLQVAVGLVDLLGLIGVEVVVVREVVEGALDAPASEEKGDSRPPWWGVTAIIMMSYSGGTSTLTSSINVLHSKQVKTTCGLLRTTTTSNVS